MVELNKLRKYLEPSKSSVDGEIDVKSEITNLYQKAYGELVDRVDQYKCI